MPFKLYPPGTRHGNKVIYALITVPGRRTEVSTGTIDEKLATRFAEQAERELYESCVLGRGKGTVGQAIDNWIAFRRPRKIDEDYLTKIKNLIGRRKVVNITQADFDEAALALYPGLSNSTWNRCVYAPLQTALRHSGFAIKIRRPKQKKPRHKSLTAKQRNILIRVASFDKDLKAILCLWFLQGVRISESISLTEDRLDLPNALACFDSTKTDRDHWMPLHAKTVAALANLDAQEDGRIFRWKTRWGPRKALNKLIEKTGIKFTPHQGRHTFADILMEKGASLRDLMDAGGWADQKSAMRYTTKRVERVRKAIAKL